VVRKKAMPKKTPTRTNNISETRKGAKKRNIECQLGQVFFIASLLSGEFALIE
jgi:hypothetical protein